MTRQILIIAEEPQHAADLAAALAPLGEAMVSAQTLRVAAARVEERRPDLVVLQLQRGTTEGLAAIRARCGPDALFFVVLATSDRALRLDAAELGVDAVVDAPVDPAMLRAQVSSLFRSSAARARLARELDALLGLQREQHEMMRRLVHDLRTPLMVVQSSLDHASESITLEPTDALQSLRDAADSIGRVSDLVTDVFSVSRVTHAPVALDRSRVELDPLFDRLTTLYADRARARRIALESTLEPVTLRADAALLRRAIENILEGSIRRTPMRGRVALAARPDGANVRIAISSSAPSIPPSARSAIFEQGLPAAAPAGAQDSLGFGLFFCKRVVEAHGGVIHVEDTPRWPTSFVIQMPAG